jgi:hypothetical protein
MSTEMGSGDVVAIEIASMSRNSFYIHCKGLLQKLLFNRLCLVFPCYFHTTAGRDGSVVNSISSRNTTTMWNVDRRRKNTRSIDLSESNQSIHVKFDAGQKRIFTRQQFIHRHLDGQTVDSAPPFVVATNSNSFIYPMIQYTL